MFSYAVKVSVSPGLIVGHPRGNAICSFGGHPHLLEDALLAGYALTTTQVAVDAGVLVLRELVPGVSFEEVQRRTATQIRPAHDLHEMEP